MSKKRSPAAGLMAKRGSLGPSAALVPVRLMWSVMRTREPGVDAAGSVGDDERTAAKQAQDAGGKGDVLDGVAFVGVDAALHDGDGNSCYSPEDEVAVVAFDGGLREVRDGGVGDGRRIFYLGAEAAQARAEDDADARGV
jgi:hypothetical protein